MKVEELTHKQRFIYIENTGRSKDFYKFMIDLINFRKKNASSNPFLFLSRNNNKLTRFNIRQYFERHRKLFDLEGFSTSNLRNTELNLTLNNAVKISTSPHEFKEIFDLNSRANVEPYEFHGIISRNEKMIEILKLIKKAAKSSIPIFIRGESGTGKELIARAIHTESDRNKEKFIAENCSSFTESLFEAQLFGYKKGAFTGAISDRNGLFEEANKGTLFLDEIADLPLSIQPKILRVIEEKKVRKVGETTEIDVDVRLICSTNKDIDKLILNNLFREDLYFRINAVEAELLPVRKRPEDIPIFINYFIKKYAEELKKEELIINNATMTKLMQYSWPGNIREIENFIVNIYLTGKSKIGNLVIS